MSGDLEAKALLLECRNRLWPGDLLRAKIDGYLKRTMMPQDNPPALAQPKEEP